ncbi:hypothetical protein CsSME_00038734 [Camellia sinensis var. sinensis]
MGLLLEEFIIFISPDPFFRMLDSFFFRNLGKTKLTLVRLYSPSSLYHSSCGLFILSF